MKKFVILVLLVCGIYATTAPMPSTDPNETPNVVTNIVQEIKTGTISWYGRQFHGRRMANGELFDMYKLTCAHPYLPFGTILLVETITGKSVMVKVTDRGPFVKARILDLSYSAAEALDILKAGTVRATISIIKPQ